MPLHALDEAHFGGKAASLARSLRAGLPVPPGFALGTTHVEAVFEGHPEALMHLRIEFTRMAGPCAVRSSAVGEDSEGASFAGQHVTILNVRREDHVADAVLKVRESAHSSSARAYRRTLGMNETPKVGVVVQRMIEPDCAGVMFTKNPVDGSAERVIEASWGLGEAVVAGLVVQPARMMENLGRSRGIVFSGTVLLELARVFAAAELPLTTELVFADGEEAFGVSITEQDGLYGSTALAERMRADGSLAQVRSVILVDMVGDRDLNLVVDLGSSPLLRGIFAREAQALGLGGIVDERALMGVVDDHTPFQTRGVEHVLALIDFQFGARVSPGPLWHTAGDDLAAVSPASLNAVGSVLVEAVRAIEEHWSGADTLGAQGN